jgi:hypothetical protein
MAGIDWQGVVGLNGTVIQHVPMYMNMYLLVKIYGSLNTKLTNITLVNLHLNFYKFWSHCQCVYFSKTKAFWTDFCLVGVFKDFGNYD